MSNINRRALSKAFIRSYGNDAKELQPTSGYSKDISFIKFMIEEYGSTDFVIDVADSLIDFGKSFWKKNALYQGTLSTLKYGIPAAVFSTQLLSKINQYLILKSGKNTVYNERDEKIKKLMGLHGECPSLCQADFYLGRDIFYWLFKKPKTTSFQILGFYEYENGALIQDVMSQCMEGGTVLVLLEYSGRKFVWTFNFRAGSELSIRESTIYFDSLFENVNSNGVLLPIKGAIYKEFLNHFDVKNNVIILTQGGLEAVPRQLVREDIKQFDLKRFSSEVRKVLERKRKRGFAFVGVPGTGKSTIIKKLESTLTEFPIIYTTANNYASSYSIEETFQTITYLQPCVVVMEDLDAYELKDKKGNLGVFLNMIDDVNARLNVVFIATINDTSLVHYSLINRPGRFDQVILIKPPTDHQEIYDIMHTRYEKNKSKGISGDFPEFKEIDESIFKDIVANQYTQADICEIVEKVLLLEDTVTEGALRHSLTELKNSKDAIKLCDFGGDDPRSSKDPAAIDFLEEKDD